MTTVRLLGVWFSVWLGIVFGHPLTVKSHSIAEDIPAEVVEYNIKDELPADAILGSIATDSGLALRYNHETFKQLHYSFLSQSENPYLHIDRRHGCYSSHSDN